MYQFKRFEIPPAILVNTIFNRIIQQNKNIHKQIIPQKSFFQFKQLKQFINNLG